MVTLAEINEFTTKIERERLERDLLNTDSHHWSSGLKRRAAKFYSQQTRERPELANEILSEGERVLVRGYLGPEYDEFPPQWEVGQALGKSVRTVNLETRAAIIKLIWALDGRWPPPRKTREVSVPGVFVTGPGPTSDGTVEISDGASEWFDWARRTLCGEDSEEG